MQKRRIIPKVSDHIHRGYKPEAEFDCQLLSGDLRLRTSHETHVASACAAYSATLSGITRREEVSVILDDVD